MRGPPESWIQNHRKCQRPESATGKVRPPSPPPQPGRPDKTTPRNHKRGSQTTHQNVTTKLRLRPTRGHQLDHVETADVLVVADPAAPLQIALAPRVVLVVD